MGYYLIDVNGEYLGDIATTIGLDGLYKYAKKAKAYNLVGFLEKGAALVNTALMEEVKGLRPTDADVRTILDNLVSMLNEAELMVIIQDGVNVS
jgi:hypothetical protein